MSNSTLDPQIISSFRIAGDGQRLLGGEGYSIRVGDCVFKPIESAERYNWGCDLLLKLPRDGYRISKPLQGRDGSFMCNGWGVSTYEPGSHANGRWQEKLRISRLFHSELDELESTSMPPSDDFWSQAHEMAWQVNPLPDSLHPKMTEIIDDIFGRYQPLSRGRGIIHSDLCGNILFQDGLDPCIIDFSPAYGSVEYAEAILVADAIAWEDAPLKIIDLISETPSYHQNLLRAINFRVIVAALFEPTSLKRFFTEFAEFEPIISQISQ